MLHNVAATLYRRWNGAESNHFYTTTTYEASQVLGAGYSDEGTVGTVWNSATSATCSTLTPMYRMYNKDQKDHFYTTSDSQTVTVSPFERNCCTSTRKFTL